jgi:hypothetical protein
LLKGSTAIESFSRWTGLGGSVATAAATAAGLLLFAHGTYEPEALAKHRVDEALLLAIVADCAPGRIDAGAQRRLGHQPPIPDRREQVILADDVFPVADQIFQDVEDLRLKRDQTGAVP